MTDVAIATTVERREDRWRQAVDQVRVFVFGRVGDAELAADITQDVMMRSIASRCPRANREPHCVAIPFGPQRGGRPLPDPACR